jgi:NADH-ubiquinone oxidoreductase chain 5
MNGPTPVSSLIHTATLVTAGVFLLMKLSFIIEIHPFAFNFGLILGTMTTIMSGMMAVISKDMKEIIANSTISQIAFLLIAFSINHNSSALFHLIIHGAFKAGLFLSAGIIIHAILDNQDVRITSQLVKKLPFTLINFIILSLSLIGFPTLSGFYSKDLIIELSSMNYNFNYYGFIMTILGMILTSIYSLRLLLLSFYKIPTSNEKATQIAHEPSISLLIAISSLSLVSIFLGYLLKDLFFSSIFEYSINEYCASLVNEGQLTSSTLISAEFMTKKKKLFILITLMTCILSVFTLFYRNHNFEVKLSLKRKLG